MTDKELVELVKAAVAEALAGKVAAPYSVTHLPPGRSRRWFNDHAPVIPGAYKIGRGWVVPVAALEKWAGVVAPSKEDVADDAADLRAMGARVG